MIEMDGEGRMNLANTYIVDKGSGISSRPDVHGQLPAGFRKYIEVPFLDPDTGDSIFLRRPSCQARAPRSTSILHLPSPSSKDMPHPCTTNLQSRGVSSTPQSTEPETLNLLPH